MSSNVCLVDVVSLAMEGGLELDGGDEERAGLTDRFEVAVELDGAGEVAVAEHAAVHLGAEFAHLGAFVACRKVAGLVVERLDIFGDRELLVGDGVIGDAGVDHGHGQRLVAEQGCDCFETHATVDGLGFNRVA